MAADAVAQSALHPHWPINARNYLPHLDQATKIKLALHEFEQAVLSEETEVKFLSISSDDSHNDLVQLDLDGLRKLFANQTERVSQPSHKLLFVSRFLVRHRKDSLPHDSNKLRLSKSALEFLISSLELTPAFVFALSHYFLPPNPTHRRTFNQNGLGSHDFWCFIPVRVQVPIKGKAHQTMNHKEIDPFYYLRLPSAGVDIRSSQIALMTRFCPEDASSFTLAINFSDGRWKDVVESPQKRIQKLCKVTNGSDLVNKPFLVHVIYLTSVLDWWTSAMRSCDEQLNDHGTILQGVEDAQTPAPVDLTVQNRSLHSMAAHLHRYKSDLLCLEKTIEAVETHLPLFFARGTTDPADVSDTVSPELIGMRSNLWEIRCQFETVQGLHTELESKIQTTLALLFNRMQITIDTMTVKNTEAMQKILEEQQKETKLSRRLAIQSQDLAKSMQEDSIAMKTIAIVTMFFLPGTSFAALLAMPFFSQNPWFGDTTRFWLWIVLTVPSTGLAFVFYSRLRRRDRQRKRSRKRAQSQESLDEGLELEDGVV